MITRDRSRNLSGDINRDINGDINGMIRDLHPTNSGRSSSVLPPLLDLEKKDFLPTELKVQDKMAQKAGTLTGIFAGGHAASWQYYLQGYNPKGGEARLYHLLHPLGLESPSPTKEHPLLLSPFSYVEITARILHWPVPVDGDSGSMAGSDDFRFQGFPEYVNGHAVFRLASDQLCQQPSVEVQDTVARCYTLKGKVVKLRVLVKKNINDRLGVGDSDLIYLEWHVSHPAELKCHEGKLFWTAQVQVTFHQF